MKKVEKKWKKNEKRSKLMTGDSTRNEMIEKRYA